jgi:hypothetical protein
MALLVSRADLNRLPHRVDVPHDRMGESLYWARSRQYKGDFFYHFLFDRTNEGKYSFHFNDPDTAFAFKMRWA